MPKAPEGYALTPWTPQQQDTLEPLPGQLKRSWVKP